MNRLVAIYPVMMYSNRKCIDLNNGGIEMVTMDILMEGPCVMDSWTVYIKEFGKIEEASIRPAPLTLFIGDNNSGKSYIMTLIYGLWTVDFIADKFHFPGNSQVYKRCLEISEKLIEQCTKSLKLTYTVQGQELLLFQQLINELFSENKKLFLEKLFNKKMDIEELRIEFSSTASFCFELSIEKAIDGEEGYYIMGNNYGWGLTGADRKPNHKLAERQLACMLQRMLQWDTVRPVYFPTARTGFLLTYKELTRNALHDRFSIVEKEKNLLTKPTTDFLMSLSSIEVNHYYRRCPEILSFIEKHIISGHVLVSDYPVDIKYQPVETEESLPMYVASSVVTEAVPLLLFLQHRNLLGAIMIEEPEISLHPQLQWEMARVLIRLMNKGMPVIVTTHSDIILQHINNMIKAEQMHQKDLFFKETGYEKEDLISKGQVAVYQFEEQKSGKTRLTKLPCGDDGFEAMTFYNTLKKLNEQIDLIEHERER